MKTIFIVLSFLFIGCSSHPKVGDWYEHKGTKERIKIEFVGRGIDVLHSYLPNSDTVISFEIIGREHNKNYSFLNDSLKMFVVIKKTTEYPSNCIFALPLKLLDDYSLVQ